MPASDSRQRARLEPIFALVSIALHAGLIYLIGREPWLVPSTPSLEAAAIVWLEQPLETVAPPPPEIVEADREPAPRAPPSPPAPATPRETPSNQRALPERLIETPRAPPEPAPAPPRDVPQSAEAPAANESEPAPAPAIDFEAERQKAVALVIEQQAREREYRTFSLEDLDEDEAPPAEPGADQDVFSASGSSRGRAAVLRPSRARTRIGRAIAEICHDLTGGIGVFGLFSLCAEDGERADFFGHLRPAYMDKLPVCTEQELTDAQLAAANIADPTSVDRVVVKCRLVDRDEVLVVPE